MQSLTKADFTEIKSQSNPPALVKTTLDATCILLGHDPKTVDWKLVRRELGKADFFKALTNFDAKACSPDAKAAAKAKLDGVSVDMVRKVNKAAAAFLAWNLEVIENSG